jgi:hypothetical protein
VYLTFKMPAGERTSIRFTSDPYQQTTSGSDSYYRGWTVRAKYAYLQYNYLNGSEWKALARVGLLHTVFIDEQFWARWISPTPTEKAGYFASADAGLATSVTLPAKLGEFTQPRPTDPVTHRARLTGSRTTLRDFRSRRGHRWMEE